jgi:HSP20 family protein
MLPAIRKGNGLVPSTASGGAGGRLASLLDRFFHDELFTPTALPAGWAALPVSVWEDADSVRVEADVPGLTDKDIELSVHDGDLVIRGERKCERKDGAYDTRCYGRFEQRVGLPTAVDPDKAEAKVANGVLEVTFPKSPEAKPRKIALKSG